MLAARVTPPPNLIERADLRERTRVFRDRTHAGEMLAALLGSHVVPGSLVVAIPAGGVPVAAAVARILRLPLEVAIVSKVNLPWNSEAGFGAIAFDGTVQLNQALIERLPLAPAEVAAGIARTRGKVARRIASLRAGRPPLDVRGRDVIVVDDGLASGLTMQVGVAALRGQGASTIIVAVPTAHAAAIDLLAPVVETVVCVNVRGGGRYAVADAYEQWSDVDEDTALRVLAAARAPETPA